MRQQTPFWRLALVIVAAAATVFLIGRCASLPTRAACTPLPTCGTARAAIPPPTLVQSATVDAGTALTATLTLGGDGTLTGDIFVAVRAGNHTGHVLTVTDSGGNSYVKITQHEVSNDTVSLALFVAVNANLGPNTITVRDTSSAGTLRVIAQKYTGVGTYHGFTTTLEGATLDVAMPFTAAAAGVFRFVALTASDTAQATAQPTVQVVTGVSGKLFTLGEPTAIWVDPATPWASLYADFDYVGGAAAGDCATPTPVLQHDPAPDLDIRGATLYYQMPGGTPQKLVDLPCYWEDLNLDGANEWSWCRSSDLGIPLQRYCPSCTPLTEYEFSMKWYDANGNLSTDFSPWVSVCFSQECKPPAACN